MIYNGDGSVALQELRDDGSGYTRERENYEPDPQPVAQLRPYSGVQPVLIDVGVTKAAPPAAPSAGITVNRPPPPDSVPVAPVVPVLRAAPQSAPRPAADSVTTTELVKRTEVRDYTRTVIPWLLIIITLATAYAISRDGGKGDGAGSVWE